MKRFHGIIGSILFPFLMGAGPGDSIRLLSFGNHSRLIVRVDESIPVDLRNSQEGFQIYLKGIGLADLGAPLGEETPWKGLFGGVSDRRMGAIELSETSDGVRIKGKWKYPGGKLALAYPTMETFDYREKNPPQYMVDFWIKEGPTRLEVEAQKRRDNLLAIVRKTQEDARKRIARKLASGRLKAETENESRFCSEPLNAERDIFVEFYPVHPKVDFSRWFPVTTADRDLPYFKPKGKDKDAQYVRLALDLYSQGNLALAVRTLDFLDTEYPTSPYHLEMQFLRANCLLKLGLQDAAEGMFRKLIAEYRSSPIALHSSMFLSARLMERNLALPALQHFLWLLENHPHHELKWVFHLGVAEALYALKEVDRAAKEYRWVVENGPNEEAKSEGAFRTGDLYLSKFQYDQALASYFQAVNYFKDSVNHFPGFVLNRGESLYQLGQYDRAEEVFKEYVERFPSYPQGWRATFRLGEIASLTSKDADGLKRSRSWFYETVNRYPVSPGATLARIRLLPCGDHGGFNLEASERFFEHAKSFDGGGDVQMKYYQDLRALAHVKTLITMGSRDRTASAAIDELQMVKTPFARKKLSAVASDYFKKTVVSLMDSGKKYEALSYYTSMRARVPKSDDPLDGEYLLRLSQAAADMGLGAFAQDLAKSAESGRPDRLPADDIESRLRKSEQFYTQAKALWITAKDTGSKDSWQTVRDLLGQVREESRFAPNKELILALIAEKTGNPREAVSHASRAQLVIKDLSLDGWLASLERKSGNLNAALEIYKSVEKRLTANREKKSEMDRTPAGEQELRVLGVPLSPSLEETLLAEATMLETQGKWGEMATLYAEAIDQGVDASLILYQYARTLSKVGGKSSRDQAQQILKKMSDGKAEEIKKDFWRKLAKETLEDEKGKTNSLPYAKEGKT